MSNSVNGGLPSQEGLEDMAYQIMRPSCRPLLFAWWELDPFSSACVVSINRGRFERIGTLSRVKLKSTIFYFEPYSVGSTIILFAEDVDNARAKVESELRDLLHLPEAPSDGPEDPELGRFIDFYPALRWEWPR